MAESATTQHAEETSATPERAAAAPVEPQTTEPTGSTPPTDATQRVDVARAAELTQPTALEAAATVAAPETAQRGPEPLRTAPGFEELAQAWWTAVARVHQVLLEEADIETVGAAFGEELRARWEYAKTLHERDFHVPDYLAERATVAPLWPQPQPPVHRSRLVKAA